MLQRIAPLATVRRLAAKVALESVRNPRQAKSRVNRHNLRELVRYRRLTSRCNICGHVGPLLYELPDLERLRSHHIGFLRETLRCRGCQSKMRDRTVAAGLLDVLRDRYGVVAETIDDLRHALPPEVRILDTDAHSRISRRLADCPGVTRSLFYPDRANGESLGERLVNVDLEAMPFDDGSFDVVITSEVMEHVRHVDVAHREIARCLSPRGVYLFTVPYDDSLDETLRLIDPVTDVPLLLPMHIHGDPGMREAGIKSYRVFGADIGAHLRAWGLEARFTPVDDPEHGIFGGDLFTATRAPA